jgi:multidrug efflux pump subunit AcrA (membrane-fusion protein)
LVELVARIAAADDLTAASFEAAEQLKSHLGCQRVVLGLCPAVGKPCRIVADSLTHQPSETPGHPSVWLAAMDEILLRGNDATWPPQDPSQRHGLLTLKRLCAVTATDATLAVPLRSAGGELCGACLCVGGDELVAKERSLNFVRAAEVPLAACLGLHRRATAGVMRRGVSSALAWIGRWPGRFTIAVLLLLAAVLACPGTYRISCECELQPVTRRFVAAPFEGKLQESFVEPGDLVECGQILARMDGREIRWELAGVVAETSQAEKQQDGFLASGQFGPAELARYEVERLRLKQKLLESRIANLDVRSPFEGIVLEGDLKKVEGVPVQQGETLFELSPLERMVVEIAIADEDIAQVRCGAFVEVALDAFPGERWQGTLTRIHPRSRIKEERQVFLGEMVLEASDAPLRPGMQGVARVVGPRRSWAWILLHKPWEKLILWWGW